MDGIGHSWTRHQWVGASIRGPRSRLADEAEAEARWSAFGFNFQILLPLLSGEVLGLGAEGYGALFAAMGVGALAGSLTVAFMRQRQAIPLMLIGGTVLALLLAGIGLVRDARLSGALVLGAGYAVHGDDQHSQRRSACQRDRRLVVAACPTHPVWAARVVCHGDPAPGMTRDHG